MPNRRDLTNQKFGKLTALSFDYFCKKIKKSYWIFKCDCGNKKSILSSNVLYCNTRSCGCVYREKTPDLLGQKFQRLTVVKFIGYKNYRSYWFCRCECGKYKETYTTQLISKKVGSCGCLRKGINSIKKGEAVFNRIWYRYNERAKKKNIEFNIGEQKFRELLNQKCYYCNIDPIMGRSPRNNGDYNYNGLDRLDNLRGYTEDNVVSCCGSCNRTKFNFSKEDFLANVERIYSWQKQKTRPNLNT